MQIFSSKRVAVIPARTRRLWSKAVAPMLVGGDCRSSFFGRTICVHRNHLPMPVNNLFMIGGVEDINRDWRSLFHSQDWAGNLTVITESANSFARCDVKRNWRDAESEISFGLRRVVLRRCNQLTRCNAGDDQPGIFQKVSPLHLLVILSEALAAWHQIEVERNVCVESAYATRRCFSSMDKNSVTSSSSHNPPRASWRMVKAACSWPKAGL